MIKNAPAGKLRLLGERPDEFDESENFAYELAVDDGGNVLPAICLYHKDGQGGVMLSVPEAAELGLWCLKLAKSEAERELREGSVRGKAAIELYIRQIDDLVNENFGDGSALKQKARQQALLDMHGEMQLQRTTHEAAIVGSFEAGKSAQFKELAPHILQLATAASDDSPFRKEAVLGDPDVDAMIRKAVSA